MSHDHEAPADGSPAATEPAPEHGEPAFLTRARRILGGDIRPEDYLPVTPDVEARVARDLAFAADHLKKAQAAARAAPELVFDPNGRFDGVGLTLVARQRNEWLLSLYYGGQNIACIENDLGIIVLAVGLEEGGALINAIPNELLKDVGFGAPLPPDDICIF